MTQTLTQWLTDQYHLTHYHLEPLPSDASFRQYFRVQQAGRTYIAMDASRERQSCIPFVAIANALRKVGVHTPEIYASDFTQGFLLLTDFGDRLLLKELNLANVQVLYQRALDALNHIRQCTVVDGWTLKPFTAEFMRNELDLFREWFIEKHLGLQLDIATQQALNNCFDFLANSAALQPQVFMHRDYHSANLLLLPDNQIGVLDFQDAFMGPVTYDLVSLLRDCYIAWPEHIVQELVLYYWEKLALPGVSSAEFLYWFDIMSMQRHLKALLTFARKYRRDHNANYLQHIPRTLNYIVSVSARYLGCRALHGFLMAQCFRDPLSSSMLEERGAGERR